MRELLDYDCDTGVLRWRVAHQRVRVGDVAGSLKKHGYIVVSVDKRLLRAHRLIWCWCFGEWPREVVDHRDRVKSNNRLGNLRDVSDVVNKQNRVLASRANANGTLGVTTRPNGRHLARIRAEGRSIDLGLFTDLAAAGQAYLEAKAKLHAPQ